MQIPQHLVDKLNKLKNLEEGATAVGSMKEAANAAARFQELLLKYNLDEDEVLKSGSSAAKIQMLHERFDFTPFAKAAYGGYNIAWVQKLASSVSKHCMCAVILSYDKKRLNILGEKNNVALAIYFIEQLIVKIHTAAHIAWRLHDGGENKYVYYRAFMMGCVDAIISKLYEEQEKIIRENTGMELMIVSKMDLARRFMKDKFSSISRVTIGKGTVRGSGYEDGKTAGASMGLNKGLSGAGSGQKQLN
jgi:hypothetical protein